VVGIVHRFVDAFNKGDMKAAVASCAAQASIIDEFPPHEWHGAGACTTWMAEYDADAKKNAITDGAVTLGKPWHVDVAGVRAYVVAPADYAYKQKGKSVRESGPVFTVALQKGNGGWLIKGWAWAKH
jgi:SnoaL-like protein